MYSSKSKKLDDLRYAIGQVGDRSVNPDTFIQKVSELITNNYKLYTGIYYYRCSENAFHLYAQAGKKERQQKVDFGDNHLSLCAVRGDEQIYSLEEEGLEICFPCYKKHSLLGVFVVRVVDETQIDREDLDFIDEVSRYVSNRLAALDAFKESDKH